MSAMARPYKWISYSFFIYIFLQDASCQNNTPYEDNRLHPSTPDLLCELSKEFSNPNSAKAQLMNTLLSVAASKGVLPELASALQPTLSFEKSQQQSAPQLSPACPSKTFSYMPFAPSGYPQDYVLAHNSQSQSMGSMPNSNTGRPSPTINEIIPQAIQQPTIQALPLESYLSAFNSGTVQPGGICQQQQPGKEMSSRPLPITQSENIFPYPNPQTGQLSSNSQPTKISLGNTECSSSHLGSQQIQYPKAWQYDIEQSHLNVDPKTPTPNATELQGPCASKELSLIKPHSDLTSDDHLSLPQILITKSKSRSGIKKLLPAIILAMLLDDHEDGSGCQCSEADSNKFIPIPYPIPIPINNLVMKSKPKPESAEDESPEDHDDNNS